MSAFDLGPIIRHRASTSYVIQGQAKIARKLYKQSHNAHAVIDVITESDVVCKSSNFSIERSQKNR